MNDMQLRSLDAAVTPPYAPPPAGPLERIIATPVPPAVSTPRRRRWILLPAAAAAASVVVTGVMLAGGFAGGEAYASWTPVPTTLSATEVAPVAKACGKQLAHYDILDLNRAEVALAERRGEWVAMLYYTSNPDMSGFCLAHNKPGSTKVNDVRTGAAGGSGPAQVATPRAYTQGALADFTKFSITSGAVGSDVAAVTVNTPKGKVETTLRDGRFVVWWPGHAVNAHDGDLFTYDLTLRDGSVIHNARPEMPR